MPTLTLCERCDAPLDEDMNWCSECTTAPWAPASWTKESWDLVALPNLTDWPDIWTQKNGSPVDRDLTTTFPDIEIARLEAMFEPRTSVFWSLRRAISTVVALVAVATLTAVYVPERVVGLVSLVSLGTIALLVVQRAWVSEPSRS